MCLRLESSLLYSLITQIDTDTHIRVRIRIPKYNTPLSSNHSITARLLHILWTTVKENSKTKKKRIIKKRRELSYGVCTFHVHVKVHLSLKLLISFPNSTETIQCQLYFINVVIARPFQCPLSPTFNVDCNSLLSPSHCFASFDLYNETIRINW